MENVPSPHQNSALAAHPRTRLPATGAAYDPMWDNKKPPPRFVQSEPKEDSESGAVRQELLMAMVPGSPWREPVFRRPKNKKEKSQHREERGPGEEGDGPVAYESLVVIVPEAQVL